MHFQQFFGKFLHSRIASLWEGRQMLLGDTDLPLRYAHSPLLECTFVFAGGNF